MVPVPVWPFKVPIWAVGCAAFFRITEYGLIPVITPKYNGIRGGCGDEGPKRAAVGQAAED